MAAFLLSDSTESKPASSMNRRVSTCSIAIAFVTPAYDRNPQQFMDIYQAKAGDYRKAVQSIHRSTASPSHLALPVMVKKLD